MRKTSRKLKRLINEEERTMAKIEELQEYLKELRMARKDEENRVILQRIRGMKMDARGLYDLLEGIREGTITPEALQELLDGAGEETEDETGPDPWNPEAAAADVEDTGKDKTESPPQPLDTESGT